MDYYVLRHEARLNQAAAKLFEVTPRTITNWDDLKKEAEKGVPGVTAPEETFFRHHFPSASLTQWRKSIVEEGCERLLLTIDAGVATNTVNQRDFQLVTVNTFGCDTVLLARQLLEGWTGPEPEPQDERTSRLGMVLDICPIRRPDKNRNR